MDLEDHDSPTPLECKVILCVQEVVKRLKIPQDDIPDIDFLSDGYTTMSGNRMNFKDYITEMEEFHKEEISFVLKNKKKSDSFKYKVYRTCPPKESGYILCMDIVEEILCAWIPTSSAEI